MSGVTHECGRHSMASLSCLMSQLGGWESCISPFVTPILQSLSGHGPSFREGDCTFYMATGFQDGKHKSCQASEGQGCGTMSLPAHSIGQSKLQGQPRASTGEAMDSTFWWEERQRIVGIFISTILIKFHQT